MSDWYCLAGTQQFGPVGPDVLKQWVSQGRLTPATLVWSRGMDDWQPAGQVEELTDVFTMLGPPVQVAPSVALAAPNAPGAVTGLVLGILSVALGGFLGSGLVLGILALHYRGKALRTIEAEPLQYSGRGMVSATYVLGIIGLIFGGLGLVYVLFWGLFLAFFVWGAAAGALP